MQRRSRAWPCPRRPAEPAGKRKRWEGEGGDRGAGAADALGMVGGRRWAAWEGEGARRRVDALSFRPVGLGGGGTHVGSPRHRGLGTT